MRKADIAIAAAAIVALIVLTLLRNAAQAPKSEPSTFDTGASGYAALYDLLKNERIAVGRFEDPLSAMPPHNATLVLAGDGALNSAAAGRDGTRAIDAWVRAGGTLVLADPAASSQILGIPKSKAAEPAHAVVAVTGCAYAGARALYVQITPRATFEASCTAGHKTLLFSGKRAAATVYRHGKGIVAVIAGPDVFDNTHLTQRQNAAFAFALFAPSRSVLFDERIYGYAAGHSFGDVLAWPVRAAIAVSILALLLAAVGANLPFAPPIPADPPDERDTSAYIASLARMLERGGAGEDVIKRLAQNGEAVLRTRAAADPQAAEMSNELVQLQISSAPRAARLLRTGRIFARVRKDYT
jgi:hypothetical protein